MNRSELIIQTTDLYLAKPKFEDWRSMYYNVWSQEKTAKYMLWNVTKSEEDARLRMEKTLRHMENHEAYLVYEKESGEAIGFAGMTQIAEGVFEDTGIALGPEYVGKGYGKQVLNALINQAKTRYNAKEFVCSCRKQNIASVRLQKSCGFTYTHSESRTDPRTGEGYVLDFYKVLLGKVVLG